MKRGAIERRVRHLARQPRRRAKGWMMRDGSFVGEWSPRLFMDIRGVDMASAALAAVANQLTTLGASSSYTHTFTIEGGASPSLSGIVTLELFDATLTYTPPPPAGPPFGTMGEWRAYLMQEYNRDCMRFLDEAAMLAQRSEPSVLPLGSEQWAAVMNDERETASRLAGYLGYLRYWKARGCYDGGTELVYVNREQDGA